MKNTAHKLFFILFIPALILSYAGISFSSEPNASSLSGSDQKSLFEELSKKTPDKKIIDSIITRHLLSTGECKKAGLAGITKVAGTNIAMIYCDSGNKEGRTLDFVLLHSDNSSLNIWKTPVVYRYVDHDTLEYKIGLADKIYPENGFIALSFSYDRMIGDTGTSASGFIMFPVSTERVSFGKPEVIFTSVDDWGDSPFVSVSEKRTSILEVVDLDGKPPKEMVLYESSISDTKEEMDDPESGKSTITKNITPDWPKIYYQENNSFRSISGPEAFGKLYRKDPAKFLTGDFKFAIVATEKTESAAKAKSEQFKKKTGLQLNVYSTNFFSNLKNGLFIVGIPSYNEEEEEAAISAAKKAGLDIYMKKANK